MADVTLNTYSLPGGITMSMQLQSNSSMTITFYQNGENVFQWNSGTFITCAALSGGVGLAVWAYSGGNTALASLTMRLSALGCTYAVEQLQDSSGGGEGGDSGGVGGDGGGGPNPSQTTPKIPGGYWQIPEIVTGPEPTTEAVTVSPGQQAESYVEPDPAVFVGVADPVF